MLAFTLPSNWVNGTSAAGVSIVATHVDSPNLRIRPVSKKSTLGYLQVGVETSAFILLEKNFFSKDLKHLYTDMDPDFGIHGWIVIFQLQDELLLPTKRKQNSLLNSLK